VKHIALIGLAGSGKTTFGKLLAERLGMPFVDLDCEVERSMGMPVREIFELSGEKFFRDMESQAVRDAVGRAPSVIATGGGVVLRGENVSLLRESCFVVFLDRDPEDIARDLANDDSRPLFSSTEKIYEMARERRLLYLSSADAPLSNDAGEGEILDALTAMVRAEFPPGGYAVIGSPIAHTRSPAIHGAIFESLGIGESYCAIHIPRGSLPEFAKKVRLSCLKGFNVTLPHKLDIIPLLDGISDEARVSGAVNTVDVRDGKFYGYNTDMMGLLESLRETGYDYRGGNVVILGAGGAARGVAVKAALEGAACVTVLGRNIEKASGMVSDIRSVTGARISAGSMSPEDMARSAYAADILINATPLGMNGVDGDFSSAQLDSLDALPPGALVCDLIYNPSVTTLMDRADSLGRATLNGLGMLIYQAILADEIFLGRKLDKTALYKIARERLLDDHSAKTGRYGGTDKCDKGGYDAAQIDNPGDKKRGYPHAGSYGRDAASVG
jgi:shikimate dehydrogenase